MVDYSPSEFRLKCFEDFNLFCVQLFLEVALPVFTVPTFAGLSTMSFVPFGVRCHQFC